MPGVAQPSEPAQQPGLPSRKTRQSSGFTHLFGFGGFDARWRDALIAALIPAPGRGLPGLETLDLTAFWARFHATAPTHLRLGLRVATVLVGVVLPCCMLRGRSLARLDADGREAVVVCAARLPGFRALLDVAKVVACLAYFADAQVLACVRERR